jgi:hypothetical protein
MRAGRYP